MGGDHAGVQAFLVRQCLVVVAGFHTDLRQQAFRLLHQMPQAAAHRNLIGLLQAIQRFGQAVQLVVSAAQMQQHMAFAPKIAMVLIQCTRVVERGFCLGVIVLLKIDQP